MSAVDAVKTAEVAGDATGDVSKQQGTAAALAQTPLGATARPNIVLTFAG